MQEFLKKRGWLLAGAALLLCALLLWESLRASSAAPAATEPPAPTALVDGSVPTLSAPDIATAIDPDAQKVRIAELMLRNKATLRDEEGDFSDWVELLCCVEEPVDVGGWRLTDRETRVGFLFPDGTVLQPGERLLLFADGKDRQGHLPFALSAGETLYLYTDLGALADAVLCPEGEADRSWLPDGTGGCVQQLYPTPGFSDDAAGFDAYMATLACPGPLQINEVSPFDRSDRFVGTLGYSDWLELKNVSDAPLELSDYYISDDEDEPLLFRLPEKQLEPGELFLIRCDTDAPTWGLAPVCPAFSLSSEGDRVYLSDSEGALLDYVALRDIPAQGSCGRMEGQDGFFLFAAASPGAENTDGRRRMAAAPVAAEPDGVYEGVESVTVTLRGEGDIFYTTDGSYPTPLSQFYVEPIVLEKTGIVRAICVTEDALPSRALTLSYFLNEGHSLPVVSLVSDNDRLRWIYDNAQKGVEAPASLSFYEEGGSFTIGCGVRMHGETSLILPKKNMSLRFRGAYGQAELHYDLFGGGVTDFNDLLLRAGQDYYHAIVRNELCTELALQADTHAVVSRSRYCVLYLNGKYWGIYALGEKMNEAMYAHLAGVDRDSVTVDQPPLYNAHAMYQEVFTYAMDNDMADPDCYAEICRRLDVQSLADWLILEGAFANSDLAFGNVRYVRSTEDDGRWRVMFYDLDSTFYSEEHCFGELLSPWARSQKQVSQLIDRLLRAPDFRDLVLTRAAELLQGPLSNEKILAELDLLSGQVAPEVPRDYGRFYLDPDGWQWNVDWIRAFITDKDWDQLCIDKLCSYLGVTPEERERYFGS